MYTLFARDIKFDRYDQRSSDSFEPDIKRKPPRNERPERETSITERRRIIEEMYTRQQQMEAELVSTRAALDNAEPGRHSRESGTPSPGGTAH